MRKVLISLAAGAVAFLGFMPAASATTSHAKAEICHNGHSIEVSLNAVASQDTGHGILVMANVDFDGSNWDADFVSFTAHIGPGGHANDGILRVFKKTGNNEANLFVVADACAGPEGPAGPTGPQGPPGLPGGPGEDGEDGHSPELTILCFPGHGLGVLVDYDGESKLPDGSHILGEGAICPLVGAAGPRGADGNGIPGPAGKDGANGKDGKDSTVVGPQGPAGPAGATGAPGSTPTATPSTPEPASTPGELPRTGAGEVLMWAGLIVVATGLLFWGIGKLLGTSSDSEEV